MYNKVIKARKPMNNCKVNKSIGNLFTLDDVFVIFEKFLAGDLLWRLGALFKLQKRIVHRWNNAYTNEYRHWYQIPDVIRNWNYRISGDCEVDSYKFTASTYLKNKNELRMLSIGCGSGDREIAWAETKCFSKIDGIDISPKQIERAITKVGDSILSNTLNFSVCDYNDLVGKKKYDVIYFGQSLHHLEHVDIILRNINSLLEDDGLLILDEFFGPRRFQWTDIQMDYSNLLLSTLPDITKITRTGRLKTKCRRRGRVLMRLSDPSEAIESNLIFNALADNYEICLNRPYGGTILHILLQDISFNFISEDSKAILNKLIALENYLIDNNFLESDFRYIIARKKFINLRQNTMLS